MKSFAITSVVTLFVLAGLSAFAASPTGKMSATASVTMKAIVPEYLALNVVNNSPVMFDFRGKVNAKNIADGDHNAVASLTNPSWGLEYNLRINRIVTVCAYASDFQGTTTGAGPTAVIAAENLSGVSKQGVKASFAKGVSACTSGDKAILLDSFNTSAGATSSGNVHGVDVPEGFSSMSLIPAGPKGGYYTPTPDSYRSRLTIIVQAI